MMKMFATLIDSSKYHKETQNEFMLQEKIYIKRLNICNTVTNIQYTKKYNICEELEERIL